MLKLTLKRRFKDMLSFSHNSERLSEGGLRTKGYFKQTLPDKPLITVITVVYNGENHLEKTILSVTNQTYNNIEYIIIDGGSIDGTVNIMKKYDDQIDYWISEKDSGVYYAMSKGIAFAGGAWIYFLGSDDNLLDSFDNVAGYLKDESKVYYGDVYYPGKHQIYGGRFTARRLMFQNICHQSMFFPHRVFNDYSFNLRYLTHADYELNMRLFCKSSYRFMYIPVLVAVYNDTDGVSSQAQDPALQADKIKLIRSCFPPRLYALFMLRRVCAIITNLLGIKQLIKGILCKIKRASA